MRCCSLLPAGGTAIMMFVLAGWLPKKVMGSSHHPSLFPDDSCPFLSFLPFGVGPGRGGLREPAMGTDEYRKILENAYSEAAYSFLAASQMAMDHFNDRNTVIVKELATCPPTVHLSAQRVWSSKEIGSGPMGFLKNEQFFENLARDAIIASNTSTTSIVEPTMTEPNRFPCAILGPPDDRNFMGTVALTEAVKIPQVSYLAESALALGSRHPSSVGVLMGTEGRTKRVIDYLKRIDRKHVVCLYRGSPPSRDTGSMFETLAGKDDDFTAISIPTFPNLTIALDQVKETGIRTIYLAMDSPKAYEEAAQGLELASMTSDDYLFIVSFAFFPVDMLRDGLSPQVPGSPIDKLLSGALVIDRLDLAEVYEADPFVQAWKEQDSSVVEQINALVPLDERDMPFIQGPHDYFQANMPREFSSHIYDSVMAIGLGACKLASEDLDEVPSQPMHSSDPEKAPEGEKKAQSPSSPPPSSGGNKIDLVQAMLNIDFVGATGRVRFHNGSPDKSRKEDDMYTGAYNIRPGPVDPSTGWRYYEEVLVSLWTPSENDWRPVNGTEFVFGKGSALPPPSFVFKDENFLENWVRVFGYMLLGISWFLAFAAAALVLYLQKDEAVRRSQPFFQIVLCLGSAITSTSILTLSQDEGNGWNESTLDAACVATPWFFFVGQVVCFCSFFSKLWRLDRVLQFSRRKVTVRDVIIPMVALCIVTVAILVVWTLVDPWTWERTDISTVPPEVSLYFARQRDYLVALCSNFALFWSIADLWRMYQCQFLVILWTSYGHTCAC